MNFSERYYQFTNGSLSKAYETNKEALRQGAGLLYESECSQHHIYTFCSGNSHMIGQDLYARAGGFAKIIPIVEIELTLATHPTKSTQIERCAAYADILDHLYHLEEGDCLIITSNSGRNPLVIEYALRAKAKGVHIIAITSLTHSQRIQSRHKSGLRLFETADIVLDNMAPYGDAGVKIDEDSSMGPISTLTGCFLAQCLVGEFVELLKEHGIKAPVFRSSNMDGADAYNAELFEHYVIKK